MAEYTTCPECGQTDVISWGNCVHCGAPFPEEWYTTELVNLTPHELVVLDEQGEEVLARIAPSGTVARCSVQTVKVGEIAGVPVFDTEFGEVQDLPEPESGKLYVVSLLVRSALPNRRDLASPGELIRDAEGRPVGCKGLNINHPPARMVETNEKGEVEMPLPDWIIAWEYESQGETLTESEACSRAQRFVDRLRHMGLID